MNLTEPENVEKWAVETFGALDQGSERIGKQPIGLVALRSRNLGRNTGGISFAGQSCHQLRADHESALEPDLS